ncbi:MAG: signal peptidase I [Micropruina sp.]|uniref:signal peptidase I n=1 Tax=Micropruina sp. TaxID=2737536 RepID=UPI0039E5B6C4
MRPRRARPVLRRSAATAGDWALTAAAGFGLLCILATLAALLAGVSLIMFSTGSMAPTIEAGSVAVVRTIAAGEIRVGDIVTVDRAGQLPVTHRVRGVAPGPGDARVLTLRGDANAYDDIETYQVSSVRIVLVALPGLAPWIVGLGNPVVVGSLTLGATLLVLWAFWPRRPPPVDPSGSGRPGTPPRRAARVVGAAMAVGLLGAWVAAATPARAEISERAIRGRVITLIAVGDEEAMTSLSPGRPVTWQVGVTSDPPDRGQIDLTVQTSGPLAEEATGLQLRVDSCPSRWVAGSCGPGPAAVLAEGPAARFARAAMPAGRLRAGDERWLQVTAWLATAGQQHGAGTVTITATGFGDRVDTGPGDLPQTGTTAARWLLMAGVSAFAVGGVLLLRRRAR